MKRTTGLEEIDLLLVDGDNLLHEVRGTRDESGVAWLLPRLRAWRPEHVHIIVGLDGHPPPSEPRRKRAAKGIEFHHSGSHSADDLLIYILKGQPYAGRARAAVVTRDRGLQDRARRAGAATRSVDWLVKQVAVPVSPPDGKADGARPVGIGQGKPPRHSSAAPTDNDASDRRSWAPGRGATRKKGNPKRSPKGSSQR